MSTHTSELSFKKTLEESDPKILVDIIKSQCELSVATVKECMRQGGCWVKKGNKKALLRVRRAKTELRAGDRVEFYYDPKLFELQKEKPPKPELLKKTRDWSVWYKPAGLLTQGSKYGDSWSLLRYLEKEEKLESKLVHRLDRETEGLILVAHTPKAAKYLSLVWAGTRVEKIYRAVCVGTLDQSEGDIKKPISGKKAVTYYKVLETRREGEGALSLLELRLGTGRTHQIRIHLDSLGHPVLGDSRYGRGNKNRDGMKLQASGLCFPWRDQMVSVKAPKLLGLPKLTKERN